MLKKLFSKLIQKGMLLLTIIVLFLFGFFSHTENLGINKTIGWTWDINNLNFILKGCSNLLFIIGYGILTLLKTRTHKYYSIIHLITIGLAIISTENILDTNLYISFILIILSIIIFLLNFIWSIRKRNLQLKT